MTVQPFRQVIIMENQSEIPLVLNEVLCYIMNRINVIDEITLIRICVTNFSENEILVAKAKLREFVETPLVTRKGDGKASKNVQDIIKILKESATNIMPIFVAKDLHRIPPITFDDLDVSRILRELASMRSEMNSLKYTGETNKEEIIEVKGELTKVKNLITQSQPVCHRVREPLGERHNTDEIVGRSTPFTKDIAGQHKLDVTPQSTTQNARYAEDTPVDSPTQLNEWGPPALPSFVENTDSLQINVPRSYRNIVVSRPKPLPKPRQVDPDGYELVTKPRKKQQQMMRNRRGNGVLNEMLQAAPSTTTLYISRTKKTITSELIKEYITSKGESVINIEYLKPYQPTSFNSFLVTIDTDKMDTFLSAGFWPAGIVYRKYVYKRNSFKRHNQDRKLNNNTNG